MLRTPPNHPDVAVCFSFTVFLNQTLLRVPDHCVPVRVRGRGLPRKHVGVRYLHLTGALKGSWHSEIHLLNMKKIDFHFHFCSVPLKFQTAWFGDRHRHWRIEDGHDYSPHICIVPPTPF